MKHRLVIRTLTVSLLCLLVLSTYSACTGKQALPTIRDTQPTVTEPSNQPPVAGIDSISPANPYVTDEIIFEGHAKDEDGQIVSYEWRSSIDGIIGKTDSFKTSSLSEGEHYINFKAYDNDGASSEEVMAKLIISAQPPTEPEAQPPEEPIEVTAEVAEEKAVENVIEPLTFEGSVIGFKLKDTLKPGDTVAPYGGEKRPIKEESYFYFVDLAPGAFYAHDVLFVTVDKEDGNIGVSAEEWWPMINGELPDFLATRESYWDRGNWFHSRDITGPVGPVEPQEITPGQFQAPATQRQYREAAVVVNGLTEEEALTWEAAMSSWRMSVLFETFLPSEDVFEIVPPPIGSNTPRDLFDLLSSLCEEGYDHITVYAIGHGGINVIKLGGLHMTTTDLVRFLESHPDTNFSFLLESCHIGSFIDDLKELPNVFLVLTATSTYFSAYGDIDNEVDPNPDIDSGGEWSSSMYFSALEQLSWDNWAIISAEANRLDAPPSVVLMLAAFSNEGVSDELGLDAAYLSDVQFPQVWSPWTPFCDLWQRPPPNGEVRFGSASARSGYVTSYEEIGTGRDSYPVGPRDYSRVFYSYYFPSEIPTDSTVLNAYMRIIFAPPVDCEPGYLGDLVVEHLDYGYLDRGDYSLPAEEVAVVPVWYETEGEDLKYTISVTPFVRGDFESGRDYSQYRMRFTGDAELSIRSEGYANVTLHYELK